MKPVWNFGNAVLNLPARVRECAAEAEALELQVLLYLTDPAVAESDDAADALGKKLGCTRARAVKALHFWLERGILTDLESADPSLPAATSSAVAEDTGKDAETAEKEPKQQKLQRDDVLPNYTSDELAGILESRRETADLINACEQTWGKIFNTHEINQLLGLSDYLGLDGDYILELLSFVAESGRKSLRTVEKLAFELYDEGVTDAAGLFTRLQLMRKREDFESQVRSLFGIGHRGLTTKEKKMLTTWNETFGYDMEIVKRAYEATVDATGNPAIPYANAILERWNAEGLKTVEEIDRDIAERKNGNGEPQSGSFDTDEFFEAALKRSYGADYERLGLNKAAKAGTTARSGPASPKRGK